MQNLPPGNSCAVRAGEQEPRVQQQDCDALAKQRAELARGFSSESSSATSPGLPLARQCSGPLLALPQLLLQSAVGCAVKMIRLKILLNRGGQPGRTLPRFLDTCRWEAGCEAGQATPVRHDTSHASALGTDASVPERCQPRELCRPQTAGGLYLSLNT